MRFQTPYTILRKELLDTVRDKRTLIMMIGVPILLYPAMLLIGVQAALLHHAGIEATISRVAVTGEAAQPVREWISGQDRIEIVASEDPAEDLSASRIDALIEAGGEIASLLASGKEVILTVRYDSTEFRSREAASRLSDIVENQSKTIFDERLNRLGIDRFAVLPLTLQKEDVAPPAKTTGSLLGLILPMLMVLMIALGAFYPAVDLTAGEKERGTFETLLATPASKLEIVTGKFLTVFLLAMVTGLLNLGSMAATFTFLIAQLRGVIGDNLPLETSLPLWSFAIIFIVMIPLAFSISALMMAVAVFARSFKEAQNYITPFFMVITLPAVIGGFPGVQLTVFTQFIPIANVVLLFRELMTGKAGVEALFAVFLSTTIFAMLSLLFAAWLFQREEVILSGEHGIPLTLRRSEFIPRTEATPGMAFGLYGLVLVLIFYLGTLAQMRNLLPGLVLTEYVLILLPVLLLLWYVRIDLRSALSLRPVSGMHFAGLLLAGIGSLILVAELGVWQNKVLPLPGDYQDTFQELFKGGNTPGGMLALLLIIALSPAICEEVLFRGAILSALRPKLPVWACILVIGLMFGVFHLSIHRLALTGLLGMLLTYLVLRSGSIFSGVAVHLMINGMAVLIGTEQYPAVLNTLLDLEKVEEQGLPIGAIVAGVLLFIAGIALVERDYRNHQSRAKRLPEGMPGS